MNGLESCPRARFDGLVMTEAGADMLVFDTASDSLHTLNAATAQVFRLCDGATTVREICVTAAMPEAMVDLALAQLSQANLLEHAPAAPSVTSARSRRAMLKEAGIAAAVPAIVSITAPMAASAASVCPSTSLPADACSAETDGQDCCCVIRGVAIEDTCTARVVGGETGYYCWACTA